MTTEGAVFKLIRVEHGLLQFELVRPYFVMTVINDMTHVLTSQDGRYVILHTHVIKGARDNRWPYVQPECIEFRQLLIPRLALACMGCPNYYLASPAALRSCVWDICASRTQIGIYYSAQGKKKSFFWLMPVLISHEYFILSTNIFLTFSFFDLQFFYTFFLF